MKKINRFLNNFMGAVTGIFVGQSAYILWRYRTHPELYAMQSEPWYTGILVHGAVTLVELTICFLLKLGLKYYDRKRNKQSGF